jgi:hypothetical protein
LLNHRREYLRVAYKGSLYKGVPEHCDVSCEAVEPISEAIAVIANVVPINVGIRDAPKPCWVSATPGSFEILVRSPPKDKLLVGQIPRVVRRRQDLRTEDKSIVNEIESRRQLQHKG